MSAELMNVGTNGRAVMILGYVFHFERLLFHLTNDHIHCGILLSIYGSANKDEQLYHYILSDEGLEVLLRASS